MSNVKILIESPKQTSYFVAVLMFALSAIFYEIFAV